MSLSKTRHIWESSAGDRWKKVRLSLVWAIHNTSHSLNSAVPEFSVVFKKQGLKYSNYYPANWRFSGKKLRIEVHSGNSFMLQPLCILLKHFPSMRPRVISWRLEYITTTEHTQCQHQINTHACYQETRNLLGEDPLIEQEPKHPTINP